MYNLQTLPSNSLVLIDEMELALHPKVQINFLRFLQRASSSNNLSVIISTHSTSLIKAAPSLIHLEKNQSTGNIDVNYDCFPALALQNVAVEEEVQPDFVFYTEDIMGKYLLESYIDHFFRNLSNDRRPIIKILPVAGWPQTINFLNISKTYLIPRHTRAICFLDQDARIDLDKINLDASRSISQQNLLNIYNLNINDIKFFDITPEEGIIRTLYDNPTAHIADMQTFFSQGFDISMIISEEQSRGLTYSTNSRTAAKVRFEYIVDRISKSIGKDNKQTTIMFIQYFTNIYTQGRDNEFRRLFGPIFN